MGAVTGRIGVGSSISGPRAGLSTVEFTPKNHLQERSAMGRPKMPDFSDKKFVDSHLDKLNTRGVSRREFTAMLAAGTALGLAAEAFGVPSVAVAAPSGKIAYM